MNQNEKQNKANTDQLRLGDQATGFLGKIYDLQGQISVVERLLELGFVPGKNVSILGKILWGDPVVVQLESISISLRKVEAQSILISIS